MICHCPVAYPRSTFYSIHATHLLFGYVDSLPTIVDTFVLLLYITFLPLLCTRVAHHPFAFYYYVVGAVICTPRDFLVLYHGFSGRYAVRLLRCPPHCWAVPVAFISLVLVSDAPHPHTRAFGLPFCRSFGLLFSFAHPARATALLPHHRCPTFARLLCAFCPYVTFCTFPVMPLPFTYFCCLPCPYVVVGALFVTASPYLPFRCDALLDGLLFFYILLNQFHTLLPHCSFLLLCCWIAMLFCTTVHSGCITVLARCHASSPPPSTTHLPLVHIGCGFATPRFIAGATTTTYLR